LSAARNGLTEIPFDEYSVRTQKYLERAYGIRVVTRDIPDPLTGDLNGAEIHIDYAVSPEQRLFLLGHLFGHTVQWNMDPALFELGQRYQPPVSEDLFPAIIATNVRPRATDLHCFIRLASLILTAGFAITRRATRHTCCISMARERNGIFGRFGETMRPRLSLRQFPCLLRQEGHFGRRGL
jgi:hypothetical protein